MGVFAHAQTVDTGPLFPPPTWPGYEANSTGKNAKRCFINCLGLGGGGGGGGRGGGGGGGVPTSKTLLTKYAIICILGMQELVGPEGQT